MNRRGGVLVHVLVTGVIVALIAAVILRVTLLRYVVTARTHKASQMKRYDEAALARITSNWSNVSFACATPPCYTSISCANNVPGYTCSPAATSPPGFCNCICTPSIAGYPTVTVSGGPPPLACALSIASVDLP